MTRNGLRLGAVGMLLLVSCWGCSKSNHERIVGRWEGKIELNPEAVQKELESAPGKIEKKILQQRYDGMANTTLTIEFEPQGDMKTQVVMKDPVNNEIQRSSEAKWKATGEEGNQLTIESTYDGGHSEAITVTFEADDVFVTDPPGGDRRLGAIRFRRLR